MSEVILLAVTGLGLGAIYFLVASGLSLIYGLMHVLNFAHGVFLSLGAFLGLEVAQRLGASTWTGFAVSLLVGALAGAVFAALTERILVQKLYNRHIEQVLVTVGLGLAAVALFDGIWGTDPRFPRGPAWLDQTTTIGGANIPNIVFLAIVSAVVVLAAIVLFLKHTRYGMIIRAGVENRAMVTALGIDVRTAFTQGFVRSWPVRGTSFATTPAHLQNLLALTAPHTTGPRCVDANSTASRRGPSSSGRSASWRPTSWRSARGRRAHRCGGCRGRGHGRRHRALADHGARATRGPRPDRDRRGHRPGADGSAAASRAGPAPRQHAPRTG